MKTLIISFVCLGSSMSLFAQAHTTNNMASAVIQQASLPVLETYIPQNILDQAKQKYPDGQIYDITAVSSSNAVPEKYDYVVRTMQGGQILSQTLISNGMALNVESQSKATPGTLTSQ